MQPDKKMVRGHQRTVRLFTTRGYSTSDRDKWRVINGLNGPHVSWVWKERIDNKQHSITSNRGIQRVRNECRSFWQKEPWQVPPQGSLCCVWNSNYHSEPRNTVDSYPLVPIWSCVTNWWYHTLREPSCSRTPISFKMRKFRRFGHK